jgi:hypothetical protein
MNSAYVDKSTGSERGMEVLKHHIAQCFKSLTPERGTEPFLCHARAGDPEVQQKLDSIDELEGRKGLMKLRMISPSLDCWEVTG